MSPLVPGYRDLEPIGAGATSRVYRARSARTGAVVALKRLHRELSERPEALARLRRELEALGRIAHPGVAKVHDVFSSGGQITVVMELIEGVDLASAVERDGRLPVAEVERTTRALLGVLSAAHELGVVHRDVKPANVRLGTDGRVVLLDFGSARLEAHTELTRTGTTLGTPEFMAPELFVGPVYDPRVDLYGLGATAFFALTGRPPQQAESLTELAFRRAQEPPPRIASLRPDVSVPLAQIVDRALSIDPEARHPSARAMWSALDHPELERALALRRERQPPCLHCEIAIPPESAVCPACGSDHPFAFAPGSTHVYLVRAEDPARLFGVVGAMFPEWSSEGHAAALAERVLALENDPQPVVSFVDKGEAEALARRLGEAGAEVELVDDEGVRGFELYSALFGAMVIVTVALASWTGASIGLAEGVLLAAPALLTLLADRAGALVQAGSGILSGGRLPAPASGAARGFAFWSAASFAGGAALLPLLERLGVAGAADFGPSLLFGAAAMGLAGVVGFGGLLRGPRTEAGSPEPGFVDKLGRALSVPNALVERVRRPVVALAVALSAVVLPIELGILAGLERSFSTSVPLLATPAPASALPAVDDPPPVDLAPPVAPGADLAPPGRVALAPAPVRAAPTWPDLVALLGLALAVGTAAYSRAELRRIRRAARELAQGLALDSPRLAPVRRGGGLGRDAALDAVSAEPAHGEFKRRARLRAAELAAGLSPSAVDSLVTALRRLEEAERSSALRTIAEGDPDHRAKLEFLALEGRLEAEAARTWAESLPEPER